MKDPHGIRIGSQKLVAISLEKPGLQFYRKAGGAHTVFKVRAIVAEMAMVSQIWNDPFGGLPAVRGLGDGEAYKAAWPQDPIKL